MASPVILHIAPESGKALRLRSAEKMYPPRLPTIERRDTSTPSHSPAGHGVLCLMGIRSVLEERTIRLKLELAMGRKLCR